MEPVGAISKAALHDLLSRVEDKSAVPTQAPAADLVNRFDALMARVPASGGESIADSPSVQAAVAGVESHLQHHSDAVDRVLGLANGDMSFAEFHAMQVRATMELGLLSMNQAAYMQILGSTKSTVSALMKNQ